MRPTIAWTLLVLLLLPLMAAPASGQSPVPVPQGAFAYQLTLDQSRVDVRFENGGGIGFINGTFHDFSVKGDAYPEGSPNPPQVISKTILRGTGDPDNGWVIGTATPFSFQTLPGEKVRFSLPILLGPGVQTPYYKVNLTAIVSDPAGEEHVAWANILAFTSGVPNFGVLPVGPQPNKLAPREVFTAQVEVRNLDFQPRTFEFKVATNSCNMPVGLPDVVTIGGREGADRGIQTYSVSMRGPEESLYYLFGDNCQLAVTVAPQDQPGNVRTVVYSPQIIGSNITFPFVFWTIVLLLALLLLILLVRSRKRAIEEEILGKPQKPWTIPVERVYLKHLKAKDERAWYVVRHYLMEDEYRSSLLWYKSVRKATSGDRRRERTIISTERSYERWKAKWAKAIAKPMRDADAFEAKLQRKLDRQARKAHRKQSRAARKSARKLEAAYAKRVERANAAHAKAVAKAEKKGRPIPPAPQIPVPELPEPPALASVPLATHKWAKKAARYRAAMVRKQGDLEVKFEKQDAARRARMSRRLEKAASGLEDQEFAAQHGLATKPAKRVG